MDKHYRVISPVLMNKYLQDEIITANQAGAHLERWLERGAVRELPASEENRIPGVTIQTFLLPSTLEVFAQWLAATANSPTLLPRFFHADTGMYQFPIGDGVVTAHDVDFVPAPTSEGYYRVAIHSGYWNVHAISVTELKRAEPISFRMIPLANSQIKVQARCGVSALQAYFEALLTKILVRWPDAEIVMPGEQSSDTPATGHEAQSNGSSNRPRLGTVQTGSGTQWNADQTSAGRDVYIGSRVEQHFHTSAAPAPAPEPLQPLAAPPHVSAEVQINRRQLEQLLQALVDAFPRPVDLRMLVKLTLNENLAAITSEGPLIDTVFQLLTWAQDTGQLRALVVGALQTNPGNGSLRLVATTLGIDPDAPA